MTDTTGTDPGPGADLDLDEYAPLAAVSLTDTERWPTLDTAGQAALDAVRDHAAAPVWVHVTGDRLRADDLPTLADVAARLADAATPPAGGPDQPDRADRSDAPDASPTWVRDLVERAHGVVPRYRRARDRGESRADSPLTAITPVTRSDLRRDIASFVPMDVPLGRVLEGTSSGSTGAAIRIPLHPVSVAADLVLLQHLVAQAGATWEPAPGRLGLVNLVDQRQAFTYASAMTGFQRQESADAPAPPPVMARVNLDPGSWRRPADRDAFLTATDPQVLSSSPLPLLALARLAEAGLALHPVAVVSGAAHLSDVARARLRATWDVPVVDLYGLRETGAVATRTGTGPFVVVPGRRVWVETLDDDGRPVPDGARGEVVVTVDENPYLPLLRYRTGDHARLVRAEGRVELHDLEGRSPVRYLRPDGAWVPSVDLTQHLQAHGMAAWQLHQEVDGSVTLDVVADAPGERGARAARAARDVVGQLLGRDVALREVGPEALGTGRARRWTSDVPGGQA